jgi:3'-phosphoadenosine 5'-phosphosulfate (PAPS) 3'-phosphatase
LLQCSGQVQASQKSDGSLVTSADLWVDGEIKNAIASTFPKHGILSEENNNVFPNTEWCWVIDPIDGTANFTQGLPIWSISLGLLYQGTPVFGYVRLPSLEQSFYGWSIVYLAAIIVMAIASPPIATGVKLRESWAKIEKSTPEDDPNRHDIPIACCL